MERPETLDAKGYQPVTTGPIEVSGYARCLLRMAGWTAPSEK